MKNFLKKWLEIPNKDIEIRLETLETLLLHKESYFNGYAVLKKHLQRPDQPLPPFAGKPIEQD